MQTYVSFATFTDQGIRDIKNTAKRAEAFKAAAKHFDCTVKELLYTQGQYDVVAIIEAPDEVSANALSLSIAKLGNVRSVTSRAFSVSEISKIVERVA